MVDSDTLELVRMEAEEFLRGSFLEKAPLVPVSAKTGAGLGELRKALSGAAANASAKDAARYFRLPIDRAFAMKGFGSVVTGTLISGSVGAGDEVELFPRGERLRVRGVQSGGKSVERATPGQRTAVNLAGIEHTALKRGMVLAAPGKFRKTRRIDVRLESLPSARKLKQGSRVHFHAGTAETIAEVFFHGEKEIPPGGSALANLKVQDEILVLPGDRFIVRQFSPVVTMGGGVVLDPLARRPMLRDTGRSSYLATLERGSREDILASLAKRAILGLGYQEIVSRTAWMDEEIREVAAKLSAEGRVKAVSRDPLVLVSEEFFAEVRSKILEKVEKFQKENSLLPGILREDLRTSLGKRVRAETF